MNLYFSNRSLSRGETAPFESSKEPSDQQSVAWLRSLVSTLRSSIELEDKTLAQRLTAGEIQAARILERTLRQVVVQLLSAKGLAELLLQRLDQEVGSKQVNRVLSRFHGFAMELAEDTGWPAQPVELPWTIEDVAETEVVETPSGPVERDGLFAEFLVFSILASNVPLRPVLHVLHRDREELWDEESKRVGSEALAGLEDASNLVLTVPQEEVSSEPSLRPSDVDRTNFQRLAGLRTSWALSEESAGDQLPYVVDNLSLSPLPVADAQTNQESKDDVMRRQELLAGLALVREERAPRFPPGPGPVERPRFVGALDAADYSVDFGWMERLSVVAKSTFVWLDQLSKTYDTPISRLDQIPDAELEALARRGFTGLWLIGLWRRSVASAEIKRKLGNPEAEASAYSLDEYEIDAEIGGWDGLEDLQLRCLRRGIRLGADMVPNHMAIDSKWLMEHPEWFLGRSQSPFPSYTFDGPDLSQDPAVGIYLEDHYWDRSDAAVVFQHVERATGKKRWIYHGNDGTSVPWNDTAQLDYMNKELREAVVQTILRLAKTFPLLRFDAAMTLAKRHIHRLWYPDAEAAGAIPSRAEFGLSKQEMDRLMPKEFWREVVDRVRKEAPGTLLLAEAFWLMEGYFVRTLGMHRVYNSAFMNMMRERLDQEFQDLLKEVLALDPEMLKRFVNFLSNPDEKPARQQFGACDRYFGVAAFLSTLPGLPLFAHGQVEGYKEQYGMEYRKAYVEEEATDPLELRHLDQIAPLLRRRDLFGRADSFELFECLNEAGQVLPFVYAYATGSAKERVLCLFNHSAKPVTGALWRSLPRALETSPAGDPAATTQRDLDQVLGLSTEADAWMSTEFASGVEFAVGAQDLRARRFPFALAPHEFRALSRFTAVSAVSSDTRRWVQQQGSEGSVSIDWAVRWLPVGQKKNAWIRALNEWTDFSLSEPPSAPAEGALRLKESFLLSLALERASHDTLRQKLDDAWSRSSSELARHPDDEASSRRWRWALAHVTGVRVLTPSQMSRPQRRVAELELEKALSPGSWHGLRESAATEARRRRATQALALLTVARTAPLADLQSILRAIDQPKVRSFLGVHEVEGVAWCESSAWKDLCTALRLSPLAFEVTKGEEELSAEPSWTEALEQRQEEPKGQTQAETVDRESHLDGVSRQLLKAGEDCGYRWNTLLARLWAEAKPPQPQKTPQTELGETTEVPGS